MSVLNPELEPVQSIEDRLKSDIQATSAQLQNPNLTFDQRCTLMDDLLNYEHSLLTRQERLGSFATAQEDSDHQGILGRFVGIFRQ